MFFSQWQLPQFIYKAIISPLSHCFVWLNCQVLSSSVSGITWRKTLSDTPTVNEFQDIWMLFDTALFKSWLTGGQQPAPVVRWYQRQRAVLLKAENSNPAANKHSTSSRQPQMEIWKHTLNCYSLVSFFLHRHQHMRVTSPVYCYSIQYILLYLAKRMTDKNLNNWWLT